MSMTRQLALLLAAVVALALGGSALVGFWTARDTLQSQWQVRNGDAATLLALALSQQRGDVPSMALVLAAQFDAGHYRRIRLSAPDGKVLFDRESPASAGVAPRWLVATLPLSAPPGLGSVSDGWRMVGRVEVESHAAWAYDALWAALLRSAFWLLALGAVAIAAATVAVNRWRTGLDSVVAQARALQEGRFVEIAEPKTLELRRLAAGMNAMVRRLHALFDSHASQLEALRRQAHVDTLTGLSNRRHFFAQFERALVVKGDAVAGVGAPRRGALLIVRLRHLEALNARIGHDSVDRLLGTMGEVLQTYPKRVDGAFAGRLNGGDLALYLPVNGMARETAEAVCATLSAAFAAVESGVEVAIGGVDRLATGALSDALAHADEALARAENSGGFALDVHDAGDDVPLGEGEWRQRIAHALAAGDVELAQFPVVDSAGATIHLECPLRIRLVAGGTFAAAAHWLPMAARGRLTQRVDLAAAGLALQAIASDRRARCVHVAAASLADPGFAQAMARLLADAPAAARLLSVEVGEVGAAAAGQGARWRDAAERWRPYGVRLGLENAGGSLRTLADARGWGLDYLKVDGRFVRGLAHDGALAEYARQIVATARGMGVAVYAEGVDNPLDLLRLWELGFDGATGPAVAVNW